MHETELLILGLCVAIPMLSVIAKVLDIPYPIVLVLGRCHWATCPAFRRSSSSPTWCW